MRHGNIPQPSPTEKQNLDVVSHSALPSSSPGTPAFQSRPVLGALGRGLSGAVHQQPSRKKHAKRTLLSRGQTERKDATRLPSSYSARSSQEGAASSLAGHPGSSWGPHPPLDLSFPRSPELPSGLLSPPSPSRSSWEPLLRLLARAALDQARAFPGWARDAP